MPLPHFTFNAEQAAEFIQSVHTKQPVEGLTHGFYKYPARFSPLFARASIKLFTDPGETVLDPFMGGGTTLVEGRVLGRNSVGTDINSLAAFIANTKTTLLSNNDFKTLNNWLNYAVEHITSRNKIRRDLAWINKGYQKNVNSKQSWPIRKGIESAIAMLKVLPKSRQKNFARCSILKTSQWAFDARKTFPSIEEFRKQFIISFHQMLDGAKEFNSTVRHTGLIYNLNDIPKTLCLNRSAIGLENTKIISHFTKPKLILTSPPYPGVHILYHRWQIMGRKETPAPYWIANCQDGHAGSFYTLGDRHQKDLIAYYKQLFLVFKSMAKIANPNTLIVQMVAFADPTWQLQRYLEVMENAGFKEMMFPIFSNSDDNRVWRNVPHRKWYANKKGALSSSREVVLFHRLVA